MIGNSIKFTELGEVKLRVYPLEENKETCSVRYEIIDTGIGIAQEDQKKIFEKFNQADITTQRRFGGTGLGLAISQRLANLIGSNIFLESKFGKGSKFFFDVVVLKVQVEEEKTDEASELAFMVNPEFSQKYPHKILVIDDNDMNLVVARSVLKKFGYMPTTAKNGQEALEIVAKEKFSIILLDCHMPVMDGFEFTKHYLEKSGEDRATIIALSASSMKEDVQKCLAIGMDSFLSKPLDLKSLGEKLIEYHKGYK